MLIGAVGDMGDALAAAAKAGVEVVVVDKPKPDPLLEVALFASVYSNCCSMSLPPPIRIPNEPWRKGRKDARFKR